MQNFATDDYEWVLVAYYEGNDLSNVQFAYNQLINEGGVHIHRIRTAPEGYTPPHLTADADATYLYPLNHTVNSKSFELAYISDYLWWLNASEETYRNSRNVALAGEAFQSITAQAKDACVALIYIPSKEHLYFPYSDPAGN